MLEEYTFTKAKNGQADAPLPPKLAGDLSKLLEGDVVWSEITSRLVILSNGMMSFFAKSACEVAQHVRINDDTGTAAGGALFNQENVPSETLFYAVLNCSAERSAQKKDKPRTPEDAAAVFDAKLKACGRVFQFGGDASTGLGYCTVNLSDKKEEAK